MKNTTSNTTKKLGRPVNQNSARQIRLAEQEALRAAGLIKRGRPAVDGSANQAKLQRRAQLSEMGLATGERGRPTNPNSVRQQRLAMLAEKRANGTLKLGRPAKAKVTE
jgi:hypothetical protein